MKVIKVIVKNKEEISNCINYNNTMHLQGNDIRMTPHLFYKVPEPIFKEVEYNLHINDIRSFVIDKDSPDYILLYHLYEGHLTIKRDELLLNQLEMFFSICR